MSRSAFRLTAVGIWLLFVATNPGRNETLDAEMRRVVARQLWSAGRISISALPRDSRDVWLPAGEGRWVAPYGIGQSLAMVPFDAAGALLERLGPAAWRERIGWLPVALGLLPLIGLGWWYAMLRLLEAWGLPPPWPLLGATLTSLGTIVFHYSGQAHEESLVGLCVTLSLLFALRLRRIPSLHDAAAAGAFAGASLLVRPVAVFALLAVAAVVLAARGDAGTRWRVWAAAGAAAIGVASLSLLYNAARFGDPFAVGYERLGHFSRMALDARSPGVALSLVVGPGFGLLALSPLLLLALRGMPALWRADRAYALGLAAAAGACLTFFSAWHDSYTGGGGWGTRYQCHLLGLFAVPLVLGMRRLGERRAGRMVAATLIAVSLFLQGVSVFAGHHLEVYQATCEGRSDGPFRNGLRDGQLGRRLENLGRWGLGLAPRARGNASCREAIATMWDRYVPNFWGPVYARRLGALGTAVLALWGALLAAGLILLAAGLRRARTPVPVEA